MNKNLQRKTNSSKDNVKFVCDFGEHLWNYNESLIRIKIEMAQTKQFDHSFLINAFKWN